MTGRTQFNAGAVMLLRLAPKVYGKSDHPVGYRPSYILKYIEALLGDSPALAVEYLDQQITEYDLKAIEERIGLLKPKIIVFDVTTLNVEQSSILAKKLSDNSGLNATVIIGVGQEVSADVGRFRQKYPHYRICLAGEAEEEVVRIIKRLAAGEGIDRIESQFSNGLDNQLWTVQDIDKLPFLHFDRQSLKAYNFVYPLKIAKKLKWGHMLTSRGCPHPCIFCSQLMRESYTTKMRFRSAARVVDEMEHLKGLGANIIAFDDDDFTVSPRHVKAICGEMRARKLDMPWIIHCRLDELDETLVAEMGKAGCILLRVGIESGNRRIVSVLKKTRKDKAWFEHGHKTIQRAHQFGMSVAGLFMVGSPTETREEMLDSIAFAKNLDLDIIQVSYFTPFPGTKAFELYAGEIKDINPDEFYHYNTPNFNLSRMSDEELQGAQRLFYRKFLFRPSFLFRHFMNNFLFYLTNYHVFLRLIRSIKRIR